MKLSILIAVRGGVVQGILATPHADGYDVTIVDYDDHECDRGRDGMSEEDYERERLGATWEECEGVLQSIL